MPEFDYKESDEVGESTLDVIQAADKFNRWMYDTVKDHISGRILEIGSGLGNISTFFLADGADITLSDIREGYCRKLQTSFGAYQNLRAVEKIDLADPNFDTVHSRLFNSFDSIFALNVVEHIKEEHLALVNARKLLKPGGKLTILVPAYQGLYNNFDLALEHYRRYTKKSLGEAMSKAKFNVMGSKYFNFIGIFGWYVTGKLAGKKEIPEGQMGLFNKLVPVFRIADRLIFKRAGLSVIAVGKV